jgi:hypothetical protein
VLHKFDKEAWVVDLYSATVAGEQFKNVAHFVGDRADKLAEEHVEEIMQRSEADYADVRMGRYAIDVRTETA